MRTKFMMIMLIALAFPILAQAQSMDLQWFKQLMVSINERANWKQFSESADSTFSYDANNLQHPGPDSVIVAVKTVYRNQKAIDRLKRERDRSYVESFKKEALLNYNYNDLAFTITIDEIYCTMKQAGSQDIEADFDKSGQILSILPSGRGVMPIIPNTHIEKLYFLICKEDDNKNTK